MEIDILYCQRCSIVSDDGCDSSSEEQRFRVLSKFNQEKMLQTESISTFYKLRYKACKSLKVPGFHFKSFIIRHFYSKLDGQRYSTHLCTDASMFKPNDPPEFTEIIGVEGRPMEAEVGSLLCLGRCLLIPNCPVGLISSHVLESMGFNIDYQWY